MMRSNGFIRTACVSVMLALATTAQAGIFNKVARGLDIAGFQIVGFENPVSQSASVAAGANFQGNTIDFGDFDLTLVGPVTLMFESGGRRIPTLEVSISSGLLDINPNGVFTAGAPQSLLYVANFDSGLNTTNITGNTLFDARFSLNAFGSYDLRLQLSNRSTTTQIGRFDDVDPIDLDFDLGPINIEGNLIADLLATVTDPIFQATGFENVFASFSGRTDREAKVREVVQRLRAKIDDGGTLTSDEFSLLTGLATVADLLGDDVPDLSFVSDAFEEGRVDVGSDSAQASGNPVQIPEPATLALLGLGILPLLRRRARHA